MSSSRWGRRLATFGALAALVVATPFAYHRLAPARYLVSARLTTLPGGDGVLVVEEVVGSSRRNAQSLRFDFIAVTTGERLQRTIAPFSIDSERLKFLGGGARQWWGQGDEVLLLDVATGKVVADDRDIVAHNPSLRGELHPASAQRYEFGVDEAGALQVQGGDQREYSVDSVSLTASAVAAPAKRGVRVSREGALQRLVNETETFVTRRASAAPAPDAPPGELVQVCRTATQGPCSLRSQVDGQVSWQWGDAELDGKSVLSVEARDARVGYVYVADDGALAQLYGGSWLYAVELASGHITWQQKL